MRVKASSGRDRKTDLRDHCASLDLRADFAEDVELLTAIYRCIAFGERLEVVPLPGGTFAVNPKLPPTDGRAARPF